MKTRLITTLLLLLLTTISSAALKDDCITIYSGEMEAYFPFEDSTTGAFTTNIQEPTNPTYSTRVTGNKGITLTEPISIGGDADNRLVIDSSEPQFTIMFWFHPGETNVIGTLLKLPGTMMIHLNDGSIEVDILGVGQISKTYDETTFTHVTITSDFNNELKLYITQESDTQIDQNPEILDLSGGNFPLPTPNTIPFYDQPSQNGILDEFAFFNNDLTTTQIEKAFKDTKAGSTYCKISSEGTSTTTTTFNIAGCKELDEQGNLAYSLSKGACSSDGYRYCGQDGIMYNTFEPTNACSYGKTSDNWNPVMDGVCCPSTYVCTEEALPGGSGTKNACNQPQFDCGLYVEQDDEDDCVANGCYWFETGEGGTCVSNPKDQSCSVYTKEDACIQDNYNLGRLGVGAVGKCNTIETGFYDLTGLGQFVIPDSSCGCTWNQNGGPDLNGGCELSWSLTQALYETGTTPSSFDCKTYFNIGSCLAGEQIISWTARTENAQGIFTTQTNLEQATTTTQCEEGTLTRGCGETILKFSGFNPLTILLIIGILALYYTIKRKDYNEE